MSDSDKEKDEAAKRVQEDAKKNNDSVLTESEMDAVDDQHSSSE